MHRRFESLTQEQWDVRSVHQHEQPKDVLEVLCRSEQTATDQRLAGQLPEILGRLPDRERYVIERAMGWNGAGGNISSAAAELGLTRQRGAQLYHRGIQRIRDFLHVTKEN